MVLSRDRVLTIKVNVRHWKFSGDFGQQRLIALTGLAPGRMDGDERWARKMRLFATCQNQEDNQRCEESH